MSFIEVVLALSVITGYLRLSYSFVVSSSRVFSY